MASHVENHGSRAGEAKSPLESPQQRSRAYQLEMLDASLERNIIIAMNTGSGKTHIAVRRISAELDKQSDGKRIWFLVPTVILCKQQCQVISSQLPAVQVRLLTGNDGVDRWKNPLVWDAVLRDISIVVSTYAVLSDALNNGFVKIGELSLLIFDEAHHCNLNDPANNIMKSFYHPQKAKQADVPHILGLTASPVTGSKPAELGVIEANLDSVVRTPQLHVEDLLRFVNQASLREVHYEVEIPGENLSSALRSLFSTMESISSEKNVTTLKKFSNVETQSDYFRVVNRVNRTSRKMEDCLKTLCNRAKHLQKELGTSAADYYLTLTADKINSSPRSESDIIFNLEGHERIRLCNICASINRNNSRKVLEPYKFLDISAKVECLISTLVAEYGPDFLGLIFVEQRATAVVLHQLLSTHPKTNELFRCGTFVGISKSPGSKDFGDLANQKEQDQVLGDFSTGNKNLIIATSALDEGIDISGCNTVICFNKPHNIKSFIQRRGRARKVNSTFIIMVPKGENISGTKYWQELEHQMVEAYRCDRKLVEELQKNESTKEKSELKLRIESTGALLDFENATARLYRFCAMLPKQPYVDSHPIFKIEIDQLTNLKRASVILPNSVHYSVRQAYASQGWQAVRMAKKDAAFQAYSALYYNGLVNDHFLPEPKDTLEFVNTAESNSSFFEAAEQYNPWINVAKEWIATSQNFRSRISICYQSQKIFETDLILPAKHFVKSQFLLFVNEEITFKASIDHISSNDPGLCADTHLLQDATDLILRSIHSGSMTPNQKDFVTLFAPPISQTELEAWLKACSGAREGTEILIKDLATDKLGLIRYEGFISSPFSEIRQLESNIIFENGRMALQDNEKDANIKIQSCPMPKRREFLHKLQKPSEVYNLSSEPEDRKAKSLAIILEKCTIDNLPMDYARFSLFAPSVYHLLEVNFVAEELCSRMKPQVPFQNIDLVIVAISVTSAKEPSDYRQLAILGDTVLKFLTVTKLFSIHAKWHKGYLSIKKGALIRNSQLAQAALDRGLDQFLITKSFTGKNWKPSYVSEMKPHCDSRTRLISAKVLADAIKAMVGAAFLDGSYAQAARCACYFLPDTIECLQDPMLESYVASRSIHVECGDRYKQLERLLGYSFQEKSLLVEALTHPSYDDDYLVSSYQRLAFLGDGALDMVVLDYLSHHVLSYSRCKINELKVASVNSQFLAFLCMDHSAEIKEHGVQESPTGEFSATTHLKKVHLWESMRCHNPDIIESRRATIERYKEQGDLVRHGLTGSKTYPWRDLENMNADSFFSDIIQSLFGAIYVDNRGDLTQCILFATKIGLIGYLERFMRDEVNISDPENLEAQRLLDISLSESGIDENLQTQGVSCNEGAEGTGLSCC